MNLEKTNNQQRQGKKLLISTLAAGMGMWVIGGIWHNLVLPNVNKSIEAHHDGLVIALMASFILALLMAYFYKRIAKEHHSIAEGLKVGALIGILWVFPHGLAMAGIHDTSILYEIKNTFYHMFEQGAGGVIIAMVYKSIK